MKVLYDYQITQATKDALLKANFELPKDVILALKKAFQSEVSALGKDVLKVLLDNCEIASRDQLALCQDTGMVVVFVEIGQELQIKGDLYEAIHEGIRLAYREGYLRQSVVRDPLFDRTNTGDNTPAVIHLEMIPGSELVMTFVPKGFGCENMSRTQMLTPSDGLEGLVDFVLETVEIAGPNTCPPSIIGIGLGGTIDKAAILSKKALLRPLNQAHPDPAYARLEQELEKKVNALGIGPAGFGGSVTTLGVRIESFPTHIASIPICVTMSCHSLRHQSVRLEAI